MASREIASTLLASQCLPDPLRRKRKRGCDGEEASHRIGQALKGCRKEGHGEEKRGEDAKRQHHESFPSGAQRRRLTLFGRCLLGNPRLIFGFFGYWKRKVREFLEGLDGDYSRGRRANGRHECRSNDGSGIRRARGRKDSHSRGRNELDRARVDREKRAHGVGSDAGSRVQLLEVLHGAQAKRRRGVGQTEHVGRHVHHHRTHCRVARRNLREQPAHDRSQRSGQEADETALLRQPHHAQPQRHNPCQRQRERHDGRLASVEGGRRHLAELARCRAQKHGQHDESKPYPVEHRGQVCLTRRPGCAKHLSAASAEIFQRRLRWTNDRSVQTPGRETGWRDAIGPCGRPSSKCSPSTPFRWQQPIGPSLPGQGYFIRSNVCWRISRSLIPLVFARASAIHLLSSEFFVGRSMS